MGATVALILLTVLCASVGGAAGACKHVKNDDMVEYSCVGGQLSDLNDLPSSTGKIRISNMPIPRIRADTFGKFGSDLWVLGCSNCEIMDIEPGAFESLENLQQLTLDSNRLTAIKESWFKGLDYLTYLDLNYNNIRTIEEGVFDGLPSLVDLRLSGNQLECLNLKEVSHLQELKRIYLNENSEFKCPNAVSTYLESRGINFEKDPEWNRIPNDLIPAEMPSEYDARDWRTTPAPTPRIPIYRERLHLPTTMPSIAEETIPPYVPSRTRIPEESRPPYVPPRIYPTEEEVADWRTSPPPYRERPTIEPTRSYHEDARTPYLPPRTNPPVDYPMTNPPYTTSGVLDATTLRPWPRYTESPGFESEIPDYPPYENEDKHYEPPRYPSEATRPPLLASSPSEDQETPSFSEPNMEHPTDTYRIDWREEDGVPPATRYSVERPAYPYPYPTEASRDSYPVYRPLPPEQRSEVVQPASPGDSFQTPYYEPTVTIRPPPMGNYNQRQEQEPAAVQTIDTTTTTTTDKPFPNCPTRNSSSSIARSFHLIVLAVVLAIARNGLAEGF